jgi:hypothetical protein
MRRATLKHANSLAPLDHKGWTDWSFRNSALPNRRSASLGEIVYKTRRPLALHPGPRYSSRMAETIAPSREERAAHLEETTVRLLAAPRESPPKSWREMVGMFGDDELMKQVDEEGRRWREEENRRMQP